jgi:hypothetical protein
MIFDLFISLFYVEFAEAWQSYPEKKKLNYLRFEVSSSITDKTASSDRKIPPTITAKEEIKILNSSIIYTSTPANNFSISKENQKSIQINFDFLDKDQGGIIQVIHNGKSNKDLKVSGTIKGAGKLIHRDLKVKMEKNDWIANSFLYLVCLFFIFSGLYGLSIGGGIASNAAFVIFGVLLAMFFYSLNKTRLPRGFEVFQEEFK